MFLFAVSIVVPWRFGDESQAEALRPWGAAIIWLCAVAVEQAGNAYASLFMQLPFAAKYCGERMQAWLMVCFGESVIAIILNPIFFNGSSLGALAAAFFMILAVSPVVLGLHLWAFRCRMLTAGYLQRHVTSERRSPPFPPPLPCVPSASCSILMLSTWKSSCPSS